MSGARRGRGSPRSRSSGFYTSVARTGTIRPGDPIQFIDELAVKCIACWIWNF